MPDILADENTPFAAALALLLMLVVVQATGLGGLLGDADGDPGVGDVDHDADIGGGLISLLGIGRVPLLVWLTCFLACFALLGLSIQHFVEGMTGAMFPALPASGAALLATLPANAIVTGLLGRLWPHDETSAIPLDALVGLRGTVAIGAASRSNPARAIVRDRHGQMHNVMIEPHDDDDVLVEGSEVLLVRRVDGVFYALDGHGPIRLD